MIYNIIQSVTEKLSSLPFIEGIVLGGSRARGTHPEDSAPVLLQRIEFNYTAHWRLP